MRDNAVVLDVGCGNNSPAYTKSLKPNCYYIGLDVGDYNQSSKSAADKYIITSPDLFSNEIEKLSGEIDYIISSHNLEHCINRHAVLKAMASALKPKGSIYLSFPCAESVNFPGPRSGCLNYFDDSSHLYSPPNFSEIISALYSSGVYVTYATTRYQPPLAWIEGLYNENESRLEKCTKPGTWELYGFETIIWGTKLVDADICRG